MKSITKLPIFSSQVISIAVWQHSVDWLSCQTILVASLSYSLGISTCKTEREEDKSKKIECDFIHVQGSHDSALGWDRFNLENPPLFKDIRIQEIRLFMSHGYVLETPEHCDLHSEDYDLVITGHTLRVRLKKIHNTVFLNPESAACPVAPDDPATYAILNLNNMTVEIKETWTNETLQYVPLK